MKLAKLLGGCGTIEVRSAPLLMLIGAAISTPNGPNLESIIELLDPEDDDDAADASDS